jgi:hypothetical protein
VNVDRRAGDLAVPIVAEDTERMEPEQGYHAFRDCLNGLIAPNRHRFQQEGERDTHGSYGDASRAL